MAINTAAAACSIELSLARILGPNNPALAQVNKLGFLQSLRSPQNMVGFKIDAQAISTRPTDVSKRQLNVRYRVGNCGTATTGTLSCTATASAEDDPYSYEKVIVSNYKVSGQIKLSRTEYMDLCNGLAEEQSIRTAELAADLMRVMNTDLITAYIAAVDDYSDGTASTPGAVTEKPISIFSSTSVPQPMGFMPMINEYAAKGYDVDPIIVGGARLRSWQKATGLFAGNVDGNDPSKFEVGTTFIDSTMAGIVNDGAFHFFTYIPGHVQLLEWNNYAPNTGLARVTEEITKGLINIGGIDFDIIVTDLACNDFVTVQLGKGYGLWYPPAAAFGAACNGQATKLSWIDNCAALTCDTTGVPPEEVV